MNKFILFAAVLLLAVACKEPMPVEQKAPEKVAINPADYPYQLNGPYKDWQAGNQENAIMVLKMIKAWETKNVAECASYFADNCEMNMDYYQATVSKDSIVAFIENSYTNNASIKVEMQDWESVVSADGKDEWVTLWYKQTLVDKDGKSETLNIINDAKIENGKIVLFDEYIQHLPEMKN